MHLSPQERDRLLLFTAAELARARQARGLRLNVPEATALIADTVAEVARDGGRLADAIAAGRSILTVDDVLPGVPDIVTMVQVEATFDDGTRLAVVTEPFAGNRIRGGPGELLPADVVEAARTDVVTVSVTNTSDVPVSITSHFHFFEANQRLYFVRAAAYGRRLAIPAGTATRFDPGSTTDVELTPIVGGRVVIGGAGLVDGPLDAPGAREAALLLAAQRGFLGAEGAQ